MSSLIVLKSCATCSSFDCLIYHRLRACIFDLLLMDDLHLVSLELYSFLLLCVLYLHDQRGVFFKVYSVEGNKRWDPYGKLSSELLISQIIFKNRVAWILHQVKMLKVWARGWYLVQCLLLIGQLVVWKRKNSNRW
mgnify:CR=1 FL=1